MDEFLRRVIDGEYILEENRKLDEIKKNYKKIRSMSDAERAKFDGRNAGDVNSSTKDSMIAGGIIGAVGAGISVGLTPFIVPGLVIGAASGAVTYTAIGKAVNAGVKKSIVKYSKGQPITKSTVTKLLNACKTTKDLNKFKKWLTLVDNNIKLIYKKEPEKTKMAENFRNWLDDEIYSNKLLKKEMEIKKREKKLKESYEPYELNSYDFMTNEEFCDLMELEASQYKNATSVDDITESINIYDIINGDTVEEFFGFSNKPKVDKDEQEFIDSLKNIVIINKDEEHKYKNEINKLVKSLYSLLKKEIPRCDFIGDSEDNDIIYSINKKYGYTVYFCGETIFELDSDNFDKYKAKSKIIKNVDYDDSYDYVDEIMNETEKRILKPLQRIGLEYDVDYGPFAYSKFKDGKRYFTVDLGDEYMFDVTFEARFAVKD